MRWINITCNASKHILDAQKHLFKKYAGIEPEYIDLNDESVETWCLNVLKRIEGIEDKFIVFGLDDYLPIDKLDWSLFGEAETIMELNDLDRFELSWGASVGSFKRGGFIKKRDYLLFKDSTPYSVSCQFSIWRTESLRDVLRTIKGSPWKFEVKGKCKAACFPKEKAVFRYIEESALSGRQKGKVNLLGLRMSDINELVDLGFVDRENIIFGWKGDIIFNYKDSVPKYNKYYD